MTSPYADLRARLRLADSLSWTYLMNDAADAIDALLARCEAAEDELDDVKIANAAFAEENDTLRDRLGDRNHTSGGTEMLRTLIEAYLHGLGYESYVWHEDGPQYGKTLWGHRDMGYHRTFEQAVMFQIASETTSTPDTGSEML